MAESKPNEFFPKIGEVTENVVRSGRSLSSKASKEDDDDDQPVEEVESLCMNCGEQVSDRVDLARSFAQRLEWFGAGRYEVAVDDDPVLQGGDHYVVQV